MRVVRKHHMTRKTVRDWVETKLPALMQKYGGNVSDPKYAWQDDTMEFSGRTLIGNIKGKLHVTDTEVVVDVDLPWLARIKEGAIRDRIERWLNENSPG